jgi:hypothetical protein
MSKIVTRAMLSLLLISVVLSGCLDIERAVVYCNRIVVDYFENDYPYIGPYKLRVIRKSDNVVISDWVDVDTLVGDTLVPGSVTIYFYEPQADGTVVYIGAEGAGNNTGTSIDYNVRCSESGTIVENITWFEPGDDRINRQAYAYASVYCDAANDRVGIYGIQSDGSGVPAIFVPYAELPPTPTDSHVLIGQHQDIRFYRLTTGEYQVNTGPDAEGKEYVVVWDGCPQTYVNAYILQDGVMTQTEVYPRAS